MLKLFKKSKDSESEPSPASSASPAKEGNERPSAEQKKSLYRRIQDAKRGELSDADLLKYTGKTKPEPNDWAKDRPYVAGNRNAGDITVGAAPGIGGVATSAGLGGWGPAAKGTVKYPPVAKEGKKLENDDDED